MHPITAKQVKYKCLLGLYCILAVSKWKR